MIDTRLSCSAPVVALSVLLLSACNKDNTADHASKQNHGQGGATEVVVSKQTPPAGELPAMTVYKSPSCGCCQAWMDYMVAEGFAVTSIESEDVDSIKAQHGLRSPKLKSCHTALIDGYVIEGHVPAADVKRLLSERPGIVGLTAPGMPMMSPGMGSLIPQDYDVLAFQKNGHFRVWSSY